MILTSRNFVILVAFSFLARELVAAPFVPPRDPQCVAFSPNGKLVALGFSGQSNGEFPPRPHPDVRKCGCVQIWDLVAGKRLRRIETFGDLLDLQFSADGRYLAASRLFATSDGIELNEVRVWTTSDGKPALVLDRCHAFAFVPDSTRMIAVGRRRAAEFDLATGERLRTLDDLGGAVSVQVIDSGKSMLSVMRVPGETTRYAIRRVRLATGKSLAESASLDAPFYRIATSSSGKWLATGHENGKVLLWDAEELKAIAPLFTGGRGVAHPIFSAQGDLLAAGDQATGDVAFWTLPSGQEIHRYTFEKGSFRTHYFRPENARERPERDPARFALSPDGGMIMVGAYGGIIRSVESGSEVKRFGD